ncbi:hypothetical protein NX779_04305 [Mycoplasma cottewii]|uniref:Uncharacterized protein n=1 Tax=Mycoplasma cottewii TaxID=51364 RepID=A0ABY5TXB3_9MOLU|nr:hypothetical protein [Mycoplasma cottewii]UWD34994.1 hypothetical protein NX779_04305 [Mycoplasma cottewii]
MNTNQDNKNLILGGAILSLITGFTAFVFWTINLLGFSTLFWWFSDNRLKILLFLTWTLNISSLVLSILCLIPSTSSKKGLVITAGIFNLIFGTIIGGILLLIGANSINANNNTNKLDSNNQENIQPVNVQVENKPVKKVEQVKEIQVNNTKINEFNLSFKKCKMLNYKAIMIVGLVFLLIGSIIWSTLTALQLYGYFVNSRRFIPDLIYFFMDIGLRAALYIGQFVLSIIALSTLKKERLTPQILCSAFGMGLIQNFVSVIGGVIILIALILKKIDNPRSNCNK